MGPAFRSALVGPAGALRQVEGAHKRFTRRAKAGVRERGFADPVTDADNQYIMLDSTIVRAHQQAASGKGPCTQALGRSRGGLTSKIHMAADAQGRPIRFILTAGQVHDASQAIDLMMDIRAGAPKPSRIAARPLLSVRRPRAARGQVEQEDYAPAVPRQNRPRS